MILQKYLYRELNCQKLPIGANEGKCYHIGMIELHIREIMEKKGVSPRNLALRMQISESTIYRTLREERSPTIEEVEMFAEALDVPIGEILIIKEELHK